ncbi:hypothetical protein LA345_36540 (plasmid) [Burkholderia vietnamiensis]|uniref:Uncharacterized protein n=1 Tax=Burkholderia vietnamiensis (strain G4 / LMG 22486) TaxID=269482 RepID=A4JVT1_BURVG|nr:conserved hypothetical protein [Burkholderia vietnamiensis G4]MCB4349321.1 hypothetical protein [Burkholderia vietnamiensis]
MNARELENSLLVRCVEVARDPSAVAGDAREANVFRLAGMVVRSEFPVAYSRLLASSQRYFDRHAGELLEPGEVVRKGWIVSLPRLHDMLENRLRMNHAR